jgi:hypothetical protein
MRYLALAIAALVASSPSLAFDGNDRVLSVDKYQALPANDTYDVAEYRPYGSQVQSSGAFTQLGEAIDSLFAPEEPTYYVQAYRPLDGTPRHSSYYRSSAYGGSVAAARRYGYRSDYRPSNVACKPSVSASTQLVRGGIKWAKWSTTNAWSRTVSDIHGAQYASFSSARNKRWDCNGSIIAKCSVTATPCRTY